MGTLSEKDVSLLLTDWFDRDGETLTKITTKGRLDWETTLEEGDAYSVFFLEAPTQKDLITRAYSLAKDILVVMDPPMKVGLKLSSTKAYTEGTTVVVSTEVFDEVGFSVGEKLDTFLGVTVHEGCHLLWTDFKEYTKGVRGYGTTARIISTLANILEDERVETLCGKEKPGLARFLEKSKYYYFDYKFVEEYKERELNLFEKILTIILRVVRYPRYLNIEDVMFFGEKLFKVKELLIPYPNDTKEVVETAGKIFDIIKDLYEEKKEEEKRKEEEEKSKESGEEEEGGGEESFKDSPKKEPTMEEDAVDILKTLEGTLKKCSERGFSLDTEEASSIKEDKLFAETVAGEVILGVGRGVFYSVPEERKEAYNESLSRVSRYVPAIRKIVQGHCKEYKLVHRSMRSGVLDTTKLAEAFQGVTTVYLREGEVKTDKVAVVILIDESGSMSGTKIRAARDAAILLNEALGNVPNVELFVYGHTGDIRTSRSTDLHIYREPGKLLKYALGAVTAANENRDGVAIWEVANRVRKFTKEHCLFFILSDGAPHAGGYSGAAAMDDVRLNVIRAEKMGFDVIQICIQKTYDPSKMFKNYIFLEDISNLALDLGRVIKQATLKSTKTHIT